MFKILLKTVILVFIILSIYFIVHPAACSNFMMGRITNPTEPDLSFTQEDLSHSGTLVPVSDSPLETSPAPAAAPAEEDATPKAEETSVPLPTYTQEEIDYAVASRYVELENSYAKENKQGKDTAKQISYVVMDDFELTPQEWEAFLQRATQTNLFNKVRSDMASAQ